MTEGYQKVTAAMSDLPLSAGGGMDPLASDLWGTPFQFAGEEPGGLAGGGPVSPLDKLRGQPRKPGEASFFHVDRHFHYDAVKVMPGEYFVAREDLLVKAVLGSCVAACMWDEGARVGGLNHFMLPEAEDGADRLGAYAMELMLNEMFKLGARRETLQARVFGGGTVMAGVAAKCVGERSARFVLDYLAAERIPVVAQDVLGLHPRKVCFFPVTGKALVKRLAHARPEALAVAERKGNAFNVVTSTFGGSVELF